MCGRYSLAPDQSKEIAQIRSRGTGPVWGYQYPHRGDIPHQRCPHPAPKRAKNGPQANDLGFPQFQGQGGYHQCQR